MKYPPYQQLGCRGSKIYREAGTSVKMLWNNGLQSQWMQSNSRRGMGFPLIFQFAGNEALHEAKLEPEEKTGGARHTV